MFDKVEKIIKNNANLDGVRQGLRNYFYFPNDTIFANLTTRETVANRVKI